MRDISGQKFGKLLALEMAGLNKYGSIRWLCLCDCGEKVITSSGALRSGNSKSCGCVRKNKLSEMASTHGLSRCEGGNHSRLYEIWSNMKHRCQNIKAGEYHNYGARGIEVCEEWRNDFKAFYDWSFLNGYTDSLTIDRINNNGNYDPGNCRWSTSITQNRNKRTNRMITFDSQTKPLAEWCELYNIKFPTLSGRLRKGWSVEKSLLEPVKQYRRPGYAN